MAEEKAPAPVEGLNSSVQFTPGDEWEGGTAHVSLAWVENSETDISQYRIFRRPATTGGQWSQVGTSTSASYSEDVYQGTPPPPLGWVTGPSYYYRVAAVNTNGLEGIPSHSLRVTIGSTDTPPAVQSFVIDKHDRSLTLRWQQETTDAAFFEDQPLKNFVGYNIYKQDAGGWSKVNLTPLAQPLFHDLKATDSALTYYYQVRVQDSSGQESAGSAATNGANPGDDTPPAAPTGVKALSGPGAGEITIIWNPPAEPDIEGFKVYEKVSGSYTHLVTLGDAARKYVVTGRTEVANYTFAVAAKDAVSDSPLSADTLAKPRSTLQIPSQSVVPIRTLYWLSNPPTVLITWGSSNPGSRYKLYRKLDTEPWAAYKPIFSTLNEHQYSDASLDFCRAYTYIVRAEDPNTGNESADPNTEFFVERMFRPASPTVTAHSGTSLTLTWGDPIECSPSGNGYQIVGWKLRGSDPNIPGGWVNVDPNEHSYTFTNLYPNAVSGFGVVARVRNLYHSTMPEDELSEFDSFMSWDICASAASGLVENEFACQDVAHDNPPTGSGGGGDPESDPDENGRIILPENHGHARLWLHEDTDLSLVARAPAILPQRILDSIEAAGGEQTSTPSIADAMSLLETSWPTHRRDEPALPPGLDLLTRPSFPVSPHRVIGTPSAKQFRFSYFHTDHLGSVRLVTDPNSVVLANAKFLPFGEEVPQTGGSGNSRRFTGHERDTETGLDYMFARYFDPTRNRFHASDPLMDLSLTTALNRYSYVRNSPTNLTDPFGLYWAPPGGQRTPWGSGGSPIGQPMGPGRAPSPGGRIGCFVCNEASGNATSDGGSSDEHALSPEEKSKIDAWLDELKTKMSPEARDALEKWGYSHDKIIDSAKSRVRKGGSWLGYTPGLYSNWSDEIYLADWSFNSKQDFQEAFVHELGHYAFRHNPWLWVHPWPFDLKTNSIIMREVPAWELIRDKMGFAAYGYALEVYQYGHTYWYARP